MERDPSPEGGLHWMTEWIPEENRWSAPHLVEVVDSSFDMVRTSRDADVCGYENGLEYPVYHTEDRRWGRVEEPKLPTKQPR